MKTKITIGAWLLAAAIAIHALDERARAAAIMPDSVFPIGVYAQPIQTFATWKARGINLVIEYVNNPQDINLWDQSCAANGLYEIRNPRPNPKADRRNPWLIAWTHNDEPDIWHTSPAALLKEYRAWKKADPSMPVIVNFSGSNAYWSQSGSASRTYRSYIQAADWISSDTYPLNTYSASNWIDKAQRGGPTDGKAVAALRTLAPAKKQFAYIETSWQHLTNKAAKNSRAPTPAELRGEIWDSIIHGAKGIVYFPFSFPRFPDATPRANLREMTRQDALIESVAPILNSADDSTINPMTLTGRSNSTLEGTWREYDGRRYYFVLNMSHTAVKNRVITLQGIGVAGSANVLNESRTLSVNHGVLTDTFAPYQLHIYSVPDSLLGGPGSGSGSTVPEPASVGMLLGMAGLMLRRRRRPTASR